ncbi:integrin-linked kinase-associated serine/threonine phosphatase 2C isoform X1 [Rana temporaria]|uniref:integrin-linked kinase-associated serine/threonine phosphatase 2C isoform X1 n=1 Tax=Rana temporaria TaxID=8407 RepID=UPI001AACBF83|nr:integrin-linked kinase-associated serine/threonine phosphatase 2C isoform X1 [Rana temporaria]
MELYDELPEPPQLPASAGPSPDTRSPNGNSSGKRKAETSDLDTSEGKHQEKKVCKGILVLKAHVAERRGEREELQDAHTICYDLIKEYQPIPSDVSRLSYFAVFDGHGGSRAARFASQQLHSNLVKKLPRGEGSSVDKGIKKCLIEAFKQTDEEFLKQAASQKPAWKDGTTAICVLVADNILYIANLGDSRAIMCRMNEETQRPTVLSLSREHNPTQYEERMRIQKAGGNVRNGRVLGVLEVSRSLGDGQFKRCGVINNPDVRRCPLTDNDRFVLLACDGLFKAFSAEEAVNFILSQVQDESAQAEEDPGDMDTRYESACHRLANEAVRRGAADNVTILIVQIQH